jgi:hypothetical protein
VRQVGHFRFIIDDEPLRRLRRAWSSRLLGLKRRGARVAVLARALGLEMPHASVTVVHVGEAAPGSRERSRRYEKVGLTDAVASSIMQRYGIEEFFSQKDARELRRSPP